MTRAYRVLQVAFDGLVANVELGGCSLLRPRVLDVLLKRHLQLLQSTLLLCELLLGLLRLRPVAWSDPQSLLASVCCRV